MEWKERDLEDWIANDPSRIAHDGAELLGRQVQTGSGRLDLLIYEPTPGPVEDHILIVELKRHAIDLDAVAQVCRYLNDMCSLSSSAAREAADTDWAPRCPELVGLLIGTGLTQHAAEIITSHRRLDMITIAPNLGFTVNSHDPTADRMIYERDRFSDVRDRGGVVDQSANLLRQMAPNGENGGSRGQG